MHSADKEREPRGARRKRETRERLVAAAFRLMAERGVDGVAINEITEAADVGFGSFYNHFPSKEAIYEEIIRILLEEFGDLVERLTSDIEDLAEVLAVRVRHTVRRAHAEPLWGRFLLRESLTPEGITRGLAARLQHDIENGIRLKRFVAADPLMATLMAGGTVMCSIAMQAAYTAAPSRKRKAADMKHLAERTATAVLQTLGIEVAEAATIARRPLPVLDTPPPSILVRETTP